MSGFSTGIMDFGMAVRDMKASVHFYTQAIGFREAGGFHVPIDMGGAAGLNDEPFDVRILELPSPDTSSKLKLIEAPQAKLLDTQYIRTGTGVRYLTLQVVDIHAACKRAREAGFPPIAEGPVQCPQDQFPGIWIAVIRDPDGNMVELVGGA